MSGNENLLGLGSLWDTERLNADFDEAREIERERKAQLSLGDALAELGRSDPLSVWMAESGRPLHVRRLGLLWLDGVLCGSNEEIVVPLNAVLRVSTTVTCACALSRPRVFELVPLGAVLRDLERRAAAVTVLVTRGGVRGRIGGVWRDAVTISTRQGLVVVPLKSIGGLRVEELCRL